MTQESPAIYKAMVGILNDLDPIGKDKTNREQGFKYRGIDDLYNSLWPLLAKHGVFTLPRVLEHSSVDRTTKSGGCMESVTLKIRYQFCASDGSSVECEVMSEGRDLADKAFNKAMAAGHKYALMQTFCIPTDDLANDDPDRTTPEDVVPDNPFGSGRRRPSAPRHEALSMENVEAEFRLNCSTPDQLKTRFADMQIADNHPQRQAVINLMVKIKDEMEAAARQEDLAGREPSPTAPPQAEKKARRPGHDQFRPGQAHPVPLQRHGTR